MQIADGASSPSCVALELDRATEWQQQWRGKVAALAEWARGPYQAAFGATNLTIAVVVPTEERADALVTWTQAELDSRGLGDLLQLFLFSAAAPNTTDPAHWLCGGHWISGTGERVALLPAPQPVEQVVLLSPR